MVGGYLYPSLPFLFLIFDNINFLNKMSKKHSGTCRQKIHYIITTKNSIAACYFFPNTYLFLNSLFHFFSLSFSSSSNPSSFSFSFSSFSFSSSSFSFLFLSSSSSSPPSFSSFSSSSYGGCNFPSAFLFHTSKYYLYINKS